MVGQPPRRKAELVCAHLLISINRQWMVIPSSERWFDSNRLLQLSNQMVAARCWLSLFGKKNRARSIRVRPVAKV